MSFRRPESNYRDRDPRAERDPYSYRDRERSRSRERGARDKENDGDQSKDRGEPTKPLKPPTGPRDASHRSTSRSHPSPLHSRSGGSSDSPSRKDSITVATSSTTNAATGTSKPNQESPIDKITQAFRTVSRRSHELVAIQLRKDVLETRVKEREIVRNKLQHKYLEFPSLKDQQIKLQRKDKEDMAALLKEEETADGKTHASTQYLASTLLQVFADLQRERDGRVATSGATDGLEAQFNSRLDALEKQRKDDGETQEKRMGELAKGLAIETAQRKALSIENKSLKARLSQLETQSQSLKSISDGHDGSVKRLHQEKLAPTPAQATPDATVSAQLAERVQAIAEEYASKIAKLQAQVSQHDTKLGEMDIDLISESCDAIVTKLPRFEQNVKKVADEMLLLRSGSDQLQSKTTKLESNVEKLQSETKQLYSDRENTQSDAEKSRSSAELLVKSDMEELKSAMAQLRSDTDQLQSYLPRPPEGHQYLNTHKYEQVNKAFLEYMGNSIEKVKSRTSALESQIAALQNLSAKVDDHTTRINTITEQLRAIEARAQGAGMLASKEQFDAWEQKVETLTTQLSMSEQSLKAVSESVRVMSESQNAETERIGELEPEMRKLSTFVGTFEQKLGILEEKLEKKLEFFQQSYKNLDTQLNNLTTENLFTAIIQHIDKYHPSEAQLGPKVESIIRQVTSHEHRLVNVERTASLSEESGSKKRKLESPHPYGRAPPANGAPVANDHS